MVEYSADGKTAIYCGYKFRKDPKTGYYLCAKPTDTGRRERLHCFVWRKTHGVDVIPQGYHVHHIDENKDNNESENLVLMSMSDHESLHGKSPEKLEKQRQNMRKALKYACEWHKSEAGRDWHAEHAKDLYKKRTEITYKCDNCGGEFRTRHIYTPKSHKFCCNNCKAAYRRKSGVDNVERICTECGSTFTISRYSYTKHCERCRGCQR